MAIDLNGFNQDTLNQGQSVPASQPDSNPMTGSWQEQFNDDFSSFEEQAVEQPAQQTDTQKSNDQVRYEYWQSEADKERNARLELERKVAQYEAQLLANTKQPVQPAQPEPEETFPEWTVQPPAMPMDWNDPMETSKYIREKAEYDNQFMKYTQYKTQYLEAKFNEKLQAQQKMYQETQQQYNERIQMEQKVNQVVSDIQQKFGATREQAMDFVQKMSDNSQFNLDNMWKFYTMISTNNQPIGFPNNQYQSHTQYAPQYNPVPSSQFNQYQRAQSIPNTMGVSAQNIPQQSSFIDGLINYNNKKKLPF